MLRKRVIPCLDVTAGRVVKGVRFLELVDEGDPIELAAKYTEGGADEICFLDITASSDGRETMLDVVHRAAENVFVPLTVGGGVRSVEDMRQTLRAGADKVSINTAALADPDLIDACAAEFGSQCVVLAIDAKQVTDTTWEVYSHGGRTPTGRDAIEWAREGATRGAGELLVTSMDRDGTYEGYDLELLRAIKREVSIPIIASGGAGSIADCAAALEDDCADAVLAASIFHRNEITVNTLKAGLADAGIPVRL